MSSPKSSSQKHGWKSTFPIRRKTPKYATMTVMAYCRYAAVSTGPTGFRRSFRDSRRITATRGCTMTNIVHCRGSSHFPYYCACFMTQEARRLGICCHLTWFIHSGKSSWAGFFFFTVRRWTDTTSTCHRELEREIGVSSHSD